MKTRFTLLLLFITLFLVVPAGSNQAPIAADDTASTTQPNPLSVNVAANDVNALGEKQKSVPKKGTGKVVSLDVSDLPNGIYLATIISDKLEKRMLGKFTVNR